jgi:hypothetical protein
VQPEDRREESGLVGGAVSTGDGLVMVWGSEWPACSIGREEPLAPWDSGYSVLLDDAPSPAELDEYANPADHPGIHAMHLDCLLEEHPEIRNGIALAGEHGAADLTDDGEWVGRTLSRL